jgi:CheY-like chemotaxis protein
MPEPDRETMAPRGSIIVVDDETDIRDLLTEWLAEAGYAVRTAADPMVALALLERDPSIDLLLTDIVMPGGLSGFDLARRARARQPSLKVMFISAYSVAEAVLQARPEADTILRKPFRHAQFMTEVQRALAPPMGA